MTQQLTEKSDVYSFGIVMLELVTARPPIIPKGKYIVPLVKMAINQKDEIYFGLKDTMDPLICDRGNLPGFRRFVELALQCIEDLSVDRPAMSHLVKEIETILHIGGMTTGSASGSSSTSDFRVSKIAPQNGYGGSTQVMDVSSTSFGTSLFSGSTTADSR